MEHHADFAVPINHRLFVETSRPHPSGTGTVNGQAIALGWWSDPEAGMPGNPSAGTLYLIVDAAAQRPLWITQDDIISCSIAN